MSADRRGDEAQRMVQVLMASAGRHQAGLMRLLLELDEARAVGAVEVLPSYAEQLRAAVWPFLQHYGRRDEQGQVDESTDDGWPVAWRPGDDDE